MVYSCIGAEIEDSDGSSTGDIRSDLDADRSITLSDTPIMSRTNGHLVSPRQQTETGRQERIVPLTDCGIEAEEDVHTAAGGGSETPCGPRPEPPPQSSKPSLAVMRQRHLQERLGIATNIKSSKLNCLFKLENQSNLI